MSRLIRVHFMSRSSTLFSKCARTPAPCHFGRTAIPRLCPSSPLMMLPPTVPTSAPSNRHQQAHIRKSLANRLERQHRIQERLARVPVAIVFERRAQRFQDSRSITIRRGRIRMSGFPSPPPHSSARRIEAAPKISYPFQRHSPPTRLAILVALSVPARRRVLA